MEDLALVWSRLPYYSLVFIRVGAWLLAMPLFGANNIPNLVKVCFAVALSWALLPLIPLPEAPAAFTLLQWADGAIREALIGLSMGWVVHLALAAVALGGQMLGFQMGFAIANVVDPVGQQQMSVVAQFLNLTAYWLFLAMDGHHMVVTALYESFRWIPPGTAGFHGDFGRLGLEGGAHLYRSAFLLAAPVMLIFFIVQVAFAIVARSVRQMNVFFVALPLKLGLGLLSLSALLGFVAPWLTRTLEWLQGSYLYLGTALR